MTENLPVTDLEFPEFAHQPEPLVAPVPAPRSLTAIEQRDERNQMIVSAFNAGHPRTSIARVFGVTESTVAKVCRAAIAARRPIRLPRVA